MITSLTGDPRTDAQVPTACQLSAAVHEHDQALVDWLLDEADLPALVVLLAGMVPDDLTPAESLAWLHDPTEYRRLRAEGVGTYAANAVIHGAQQQKARTA